MKHIKWQMIILSLLLALLTAGLALADSAAAEPVSLDYTTIIDGDRIYYSGSVDGGEEGVFVMNSDGSDPRMIAGISADLLALSGEYLLVYEYDLDTGDAALGVLAPDGSLTPLNADYAGMAIAADGRFFWGSGSCAEDGSDLQIYFSGEGVNYYDYYPLDAADGYLYYLDWSEMSDTVYGEGWGQPSGAALCRMQLSDRSTEVLSDVGTQFLGLEGNLIYYTRNNFWGENGQIEVDEGLFCTDLTTLTETRLASYPETEGVTEFYRFVQDGVVYGMRSDFSTDENGLYSILRIRADGTALASIPMESASWMTICCVDGDTLYAADSSIESTEDDFIQTDRLLAVNLTDGSIRTLNPNSMDWLFYTELEPVIAVADGRIYYAPYDMERWSVCLKSMNTDGTDIKLLAHGVSFAEG